MVAVMTTKLSLLNRESLKANFSIFLLQRKIAKLTKKRLPTDALYARMRMLESSLASPVARGLMGSLETAYPLGWEKNENFTPEHK